jgi:isopenicillin-N epimerase
MSSYRKVEKQIKQPFDVTYRPFEQKWIDYFMETDPLNINIKQELFPSLKDRYLAHGSYGSCPLLLQEIQQEWIKEMENDPTYFYYETLYPFIVRSVFCLSRFINTEPTNIVLVKNVEYGIQSVLSSIVAEKDVIAYLDFNYDAVSYAIQNICQQKNALSQIIPTELPITIDSLLQAIERVFQSHTVSVFVVEHITSPTAIVLPLKEICFLCKKYNVLTVVDGAHGVGQLEIPIDQVDFYTSNFHKWMYSPRGCAFLYIHPSHYGKIHPLVTTWGHKNGQLSEFIWQGTDDYTPFLCIPMAILLYQWLQPSFRNTKSLTEWTITTLTNNWKTKPLVTKDMQCTMTSLILPSKECKDSCSRSDLHDQLLKQYGIQVPIYSFKGLHCIRISIAHYTTRKDIEILSNAILALIHGS